MRATQKATIKNFLTVQGSMAFFSPNMIAFLIYCLNCIVKNLFTKVNKMVGVGSKINRKNAYDKACIVKI